MDEKRCGTCKHYTADNAIGSLDGKCRGVDQYTAIMVRCADRACDRWEPNNDQS